MSLQLPAGLAWVAGLVDEPFPAGDEDACRRQAARWRELAYALSTSETDVGAAVRTTLEGFASGVLSEALKSGFAALTAGDIDELITQLRQLGDAMDNVGDVIEQAKRAIIAQLASAAVTIQAILASGSDQGSAAYDVAVVVIATRSNVSAIIDNAVTAVTQDAAGRSIEPLSFGPLPVPTRPTSPNGKPPAPTAPIPQTVPTAPNGQLPDQPPARKPVPGSDGEADAIPTPAAGTNGDRPTVPAIAPADATDTPPITTAAETKPPTTTVMPPPTTTTTTSDTTTTTTTPTTTTTTSTSDTTSDAPASDTTRTATTNPPPTTTDSTPTTTHDTSSTTPTTTHDTSATAPAPTASTHDSGATTGKVGTNGSEAPAGSSDGHTPAAHAGDTPTAAPPPAAAASSTSGSAPATTSGAPASTSASSATAAAASSPASAGTSSSGASGSSATSAGTSGASSTATSSPTSASSPSSASTSSSTSDSSANPAARPASHAATQQPSAADSTRTTTQSGEPQTGKPDSNTSASRTPPDPKSTETLVQKASARPVTEIGKASAGQQDRRDADGPPGPPDSSSAAPFMPMMPMMPPMFGAGAAGSPDSPAQWRGPQRVLKLDGADEPEPESTTGGKPKNESKKGRKGETPAAASESHSSLHADEAEDPEADSVNPADQFTDLHTLDGEQSRETADDVLDRADMTPEKLRHRLGDVELCAHRARVNTGFWANLSEAEQRALVRAYPVEIADSVGTPLEARKAAAELLLAGEHLASARTDSALSGGERLLRHRLAEVRAVLDTARTQIAQLNPDWGVHLWAFDPAAGRIVVMAGADPRHTGTHRIHLPGPAATMADLGAALAVAADDLARFQAERLDDAVTATVWLGCPPATPDPAWPILCSDLAVFGVEHDDTCEHHAFGHVDNAAAAEPLADTSRTIVLAGPTGPTPDPLPETSFDRCTAGLRAQLFGGRYFGCGMGVDPAPHLLQHRTRVALNFGGQPVSRRLQTANPCVRRIGQLR